MNILYWDKPEKTMTTEEWQAISADSAPPGVYVPNMSDEDNSRYKAKFVGGKSGQPRVEIRKVFAGVQAVIVVSDSGAGFGTQNKGKQFERIEGVGYNIRISFNGSAFLTWQDWDELSQAIYEAKVFLREKANRD